MSDLTVTLKPALSMADIQRVARAVPDHPHLQKYDESSALQLIRANDQSVLLDFIPNATGSYSTLQCYMNPAEFTQFMNELRELDTKLYTNFKAAFSYTPYAITPKEEIYAEANRRIESTYTDAALESWNKKVMTRLEAFNEKYTAANGDFSKIPAREAKKISTAMMDVPDAILAQSINATAQALYTKNDPDQIAPTERAQLNAILTDGDIQAMMHADPKFAKTIRDVVFELSKCGDQSEDRSLQHKLHNANSIFKKNTGESLIR